MYSCVWRHAEGGERVLVSDAKEVVGDDSVVSVEPKIGDLGFSKDKMRIPVGGEPLGSDWYIAPELYHGHDYSAASDVYGFGMILLGCLLDFNHIAYLKREQRQEILAALERPEPLESLLCEYRDQPCFSELANLLNCCVSPHPEERSTFENIVRVLETAATEE